MEKTEDRLRYINGLGEEYFYVDSSKLSADIAYILARRIGALMIIPQENYQLNNIDWLEDVGDIVKKIIIIPPGEKFSFDGIKYCRNLLELKINNTAVQSVDLTCNTQLTQLDLSSYQNVTGIEQLTKLRTMAINEMPVDLLRMSLFAKFKNLKTLSISNTDLSQGFGFLKNSNLKNLYIYNCKKLSLHGIHNIELLLLKIHSCKNIEKFNLIFKVESLKELSIVDSVTIQSAKLLNTLSDLETLIVLGNSYFEDGNLDCLKGKLKVFSFDNKKHYNIKHKKFNELYLKN